MCARLKENQIFTVMNMKIIISPAKKMNKDTDSLAWRDLPRFLPQTQHILDELRTKNYEELKKLWSCNDSIAELNWQRLKDMDLRRNLTPALLAYEGIQYQYMAPGVFSDAEFEYVQEHLRILSGFYGVLKPFDGVVPYRLEMQAKLKIGESADLYSFWGGSLAEEIEDGCIINLASKEYSRCISAHISHDVRFITCVFGERVDGKIIEKGTMCKMARGEMVRFMAENNIESPEEIKAFDRLSYKYDADCSNDRSYVFIKQK